MIENLIEKRIKSDKERPFLDCFLSAYFKSGSIFSNGRFGLRLEKGFENFTDSKYREYSVSLGNRYDLGSLDYFDVPVISGAVLGALMSPTFYLADLVVLGTNVYSDKRKEE